MEDLDSKWNLNDALPRPLTQVHAPIHTKISFISMFQKWSKAAGRRVRSACMSLVKRMVDK